MATVHNEANKGDIAKIVIMPGDPLRAKYIAETYLENVKLVNKIRNLYAYTGTYKNKEVTVMASGMEYLVWVFIHMNYINFMM